MSPRLPIASNSIIIIMHQHRHLWARLPTVAAAALLRPHN